MSAGGSSSKSRPQDMTPGAFKDLQGPFAEVIGNMLGQYVPGATDAIMGGYKGPTTTQVGGNEQATLDKLQQTTMDPATTNPVAPNANTQATLDAQTQAGTGQGANELVAGMNIGGGPQQSLADFQAGLAGASSTGAYGTDGTNPFLDQYVAAAQRQTSQQLEETLGRTLPGRFTQAGHYTQPKSSSAFDRAAAIATRGTADALADISTNINYQAYEAAAGREATSLENELARRGQKDLSTQQLETDSKNKAMDRAQSAAGLQNDIAQGQSQLKTQEIDNMIKNLQAQALPRMIQDLGIERGMEVFNQRVNSLLSTLGIAAGATRPVIGNSSSSSSSQVGIK